MTAVIQLPCCYCDVPLVFDFGPPDGKTRAWRHLDTGEVYAGECFCEDAPHKRLYGVNGRFDCPTWRDDHCALPDRSTS